MENFDEYVRQSEPDKREKGAIWQAAIGLQQVDGLTPSAYLMETAKQNIEGDITFDEVNSRLDAYYKTQTHRKIDADDRTEEADKVSARVAELLSEKAFSFSPAEYIGIHRRLFIGIYKLAGKIRDYNITKSEWVLGGETVFYASAPLIREALDHDFREEKSFSYKGLTKQEQVEHIAKFVSGLWQVHAFGEGNTRTTAVFAIKYLRTFGFSVDNEPFANNSWYFRNALVRANYSNLAKNIHATPKYLMRFFGNLLFDESNILKNRMLHINFVENLLSNDAEMLGVSDTESAEKFLVNNEKFPAKGKKFLVNNERFPVVGLEIMKLMKNNPNITIVELSRLLNISDRAVKNNINKLREKGIISRVGSDKTGHWKVKQ